MTAEALLGLLDERPFRPLRLRFSDGQRREIHRPEMAMVSPTSIWIGITADGQSRLAEKIVRCSLTNIVEVEPVQSAN